MATNILDLTDYVQKQGELGRQRGIQSRLGSLAQQAYSGSPEQRDFAIGEAVGVDPRAGFQLQDQLNSQEDRRNKQLGNMARILVGAPEEMRPQLYQQMRGELSSLGLQSVPEQYSPQIDGLAQQLAAVYGGGGTKRDNIVVGPGSAVLGPDGSVVYERPFSPAKEQIIYDQEGNAYWADPETGIRPATLGSPQAGAGTRGGAGTLMDSAANAAGESLPNPATEAQSFAAMFPGTQVSSLRRTPEHNREVGGVPDSQHIRGTAADFVPPPGQKPQFMAEARRMGWEVIDEGDHVHVELPTGVRAAGGPKFGPRRADNVPSGYQRRADGMGLEPIPGGPADRKNNPTPADQAKAEMGMRKEVSDRVKDSRTVMNMYQKVQAAASQPSAANDLALIFAYMKMLDPGSVVREQEFANAQNAAGVPDQIRNMYNRAKDGERLNPSQREKFVGSARQIAEVASQQISNTAREYQDTAEQYGYDPTRATGLADFRGVSADVTSAPAAPAGNAEKAVLRWNPATQDFE